MKTAFFALLTLLAAGCAQYEYDLVQPQTLARHIGKTEISVPVDPLIYRLQTIESHLVMGIQNPTDDPIMLIGDRSAIVDPQGQSHGLMSRTIAPHSFIRFVLPPFPNVYEWDNDYWVGGYGYGGYGYRRGPRRFYRGYYGGIYGGGFYGGPGYVAVYDSSDPAYFDWSGETDVRMNLKFDRAGKQFDHSFVFHRRKAD